MQQAEAIGAMTVLDEHGAPVRLDTLWRDRPAVLAFVRHFGWLHCREHVVQLHREIDSLHAAGVELHVIGNGPPMFIAGFRETTGYDGPLYTDPSLEVYRAAELRSGLRTILTVGALTRTVGSFRRGFRQGRTQGSALQQGGVLVIARDGRVLWQHISSGPGDNATAQDILSALRAAA